MPRKTVINSGAQMSCTHTRCGAPTTSEECTPSRREETTWMPPSLTKLTLIKSIVKSREFLMVTGSQTENLGKYLIAVDRTGPMDDN